MDPDMVDLDSTVRRFIEHYSNSYLTFCGKLEAKHGMAGFAEFRPVWEKSWEELGIQNIGPNGYTITRSDGTHYYRWDGSHSMVPNLGTQCYAVVFVHNAQGRNYLSMPIKGGLLTAKFGSRLFDELLTGACPKLVFCDRHKDDAIPDPLRLARNCVKLHLPRYLPPGIFENMAVDLVSKWMPTSANNCLWSVKADEDARFVLVTPQGRPRVPLFQPAKLVVEAGGKGKEKTKEFDRPFSSVEDVDIDLKKVVVSVKDDSVLVTPIAGPSRSVEFHYMRKATANEQEDSVELNRVVPDPSEKVFGVVCSRTATETNVSVHFMGYPPLPYDKVTVPKAELDDSPGPVVAKFIGKGPCKNKLVDMANKYVDESFRCKEASDSIKVKHKLDGTLHRGVGSVSVDANGVVLDSESVGQIGEVLNAQQKAMFDYALLHGKLVRESTGTGLIVITGLSGVGKSTMGSKLAGELGWVLIDVDKFRSDKIPRVDLSNGMNCKNFDCDEVTDWKELSHQVNLAAKKGGVIVGVHVPPHILPPCPRLWFELTHYGDGSTPDTAIIAAARIKTKGWVGSEIARDRVYIDEVLIPYWNSRKHLHDVNYYVPVCVLGNRVARHDIKTKLCAATSAYFSVIVAVLGDGFGIAAHSDRFFGERDLTGTCFPFGPKVSVSVKRKRAWLSASREVWVKVITRIRPVPHTVWPSTRVHLREFKGDDRPYRTPFEGGGSWV